MNTTTEKRLQVTLDGPPGCGKTIVGAAIAYDLALRGVQVSVQDEEGLGRPLVGPWAASLTLEDFVVDIRTAGAPGTPLTVADRYSEPTDAELAEAVRGACAALNAAIKAARDAGLTVEVEGNNRLRQVQVASITRPL